MNPGIKKALGYKLDVLYGNESDFTQSFGLDFYKSAFIPGAEALATILREKIEAARAENRRFDNNDRFTKGKESVYFELLELLTESPEGPK